MPRNYHIGIKGTFMDKSTHEKYFAAIASNTDASVNWKSPKGVCESVRVLPGRFYSPF